MSGFIVVPYGNVGYKINIPTGGLPMVAATVGVIPFMSVQRSLE